MLRIIALSGLPGAGKTRLAQALATPLRARLLSRDQLRSECFPRLPNEQGKAMAFERLLTLVRDAASTSPEAVWLIDGMPFGKRGQQLALERAVEHAGGQLHWIFLDATRAVARARIAAQTGHPAPDRTPALVDEVGDRFTAPHAAWRLDASLPPAVLVAQVMSLLGERP